jgi:hypothetical protein
MSNVKKPNSNVSSNEPLKNGFLTNNKNWTQFHASDCHHSASLSLSLSKYSFSTTSISYCLRPFLSKYKESNESKTTIQTVLISSIKRTQNKAKIMNFVQSNKEKCPSNRHPQNEFAVWIPNFERKMYHTMTPCTKNGNKKCNLYPLSIVQFSETRKSNTV